MDKRSITAIVLIIVLAGGGFYFLNARHERQVAELKKQAAIAEAAAKRAQDILKQQKVGADVQRADAGPKSKDIVPKK